MKYQLVAKWTRECHAISSQHIPGDASENERQHCIDNAMNQLLISISGSVRGVDPTTIRFELEEIG